MTLHAIGTFDRDGVAAEASGTSAAAATRAKARALLLEHARAALDDDAALWLDDCLDAVAEAVSEAAARTDADPARPDAGTGNADAVPRTFELAFGLVPKRIRGAPLAGGARTRRTLREAAAALVPGWHPERWSLAETTRVLLLCAAGERAAPVLFARALDGADALERAALYRALPLLPPHGDIVRRVRRELDGDATDAFAAIAHDNPWPARHLDEASWNRLVLKALESGGALAPIHGLAERANAALAVELLARARERRAAGLPIPLELWRALGPHATRRALAPFLPPAGRRTWPAGESGAALALVALASRDRTLRAVALARAPHAFLIRTGRLGWKDLARCKDCPPPGPPGALC